MLRNMQHANSHPSVAEVLAVSRTENDTFTQITAELDRQGSAWGKVVLQQRIGELRPGKGDALNTAFQYFLGRPWQRLHLYDSDISNFHPGWVDRAEHAGDEGFPVVRHIYPRAATDGMITAFITRPVFALLFPGTGLAQLSQPLGGEMMLDRAVVEGLSQNSLVQTQSDWGIDTMISYTQALHGWRIKEIAVSEGKQHQLYGELTELKTMLNECFASLQTIYRQPSAETSSAEWLVSEPLGTVPIAVQQAVGYDHNQTEKLASTPLDVTTQSLLERLGEDLGEEIPSRWQSHLGVGKIGGELWMRLLSHLLPRFQLGKDHWEGMLFRLWVMRVLTYTTTQVAHGYQNAIGYLDRTFSIYQNWGKGVYRVKL